MRRSGQRVPDRGSGGDARIEYFEDRDSGDFFACVGPTAIDGLFRLRNPSPLARWEWLEPESAGWDAVHQRIYYAGRADAIDPAELSFPLPDLPPPQCGAATVAAGGSGGEGSGAAIPADRFPALRKLLSTRDTVEIYLLLREDEHETQFGDGEFHYFATASFSLAAAAAYRVSHARESIRFQLSRGLLRSADDDLVLSNMPAGRHDRWHASAVLRALEEEASGPIRFEHRDRE